MPPAKGLIWQFFLPGEKQNNSHNRAHCRGCIENSRPEGLADEVDDEGNVLLASESWVKDGMYSSQRMTDHVYFPRFVSKAFLRLSVKS